MLEEGYQRTLDLLLSRLPCHVAIPEAWKDFSQRRGMLPLAPNEQRRFPRVHYVDFAICEALPTLPSVERRHEFCKVYTKNLSRCGLAFLSTFQFYPGESPILWTHRGKLQCEVMRCQKHNHQCYEVGTKF